MNHRPVCVKCEVDLMPEHNGALIVEMFQDNKLVYKFWYADIWKCPICGNEVVFGFGDQPIICHYETTPEWMDEFIETESKTRRVVYIARRLKDNANRRNVKRN